MSKETSIQMLALLKSFLQAWKLQAFPLKSGETQLSSAVIIDFYQFYTDADVCSLSIRAFSFQSPLLWKHELQESSLDVINA